MKQITRIYLVLFVATLPFVSASAQDVTDTLETAVVNATRFVFVTKKDTVVYNLDAVVLHAGDMLQDVLERLPGLELRDGKLYFKGKAVQRVLVNGDDFIQNDTKTLIQNMPAYMVKHVKAYERKSDFTMRTGIEDGEREQTIDIILKRKYLGSWNVNALAAGGSDNHWRLRGFGMHFTDNASLTLWGAGNNIADAENGADNGRFIDPLLGQNTGRHTTYKKAGIHGKWGNSIATGHKGHFKAWGNINWNGNRHGNEFHATASETFYDAASLFSVSRKHTFSNSHEFSGWGKVEYNIRDNTWFEFRPSFSIGNSERRSTDEDAQWRENPYGEETIGNLRGAKAFWPLDSILNGTLTAQEGADYVARVQDNSESRSKSYNHSFHFSHRFSPAVEFDLYNTLSYNTSRDEQRSTGTWQYFNDMPLPTILTPIKEDVGFSDYTRPDHCRAFSHETNANVYVQITKRVNVRALYAIGGKVSHSGGDAYRFDREAYDPDNSRHICHHLLPQKAEVGAQYSGKHLFASVALTGHFTQERYNIERSGDTQHLKRNTGDYYAKFQARLNTDNIGQFIWKYDFSIVTPNITYLITLPNRTSPTYNPLGNADLHSTHKHYARFQYGKSGKNMKWLNVAGECHFYHARIITALTYNPETGIRTAQPQNVNGTWESSVLFMAGTPIDHKKRLNSVITLLYAAAHNVGWVDSRYSVTTHTPQINLRFSYKRGKTGIDLETGYQYSTRLSNNSQLNNLNNWSWKNALRLRTTLPFEIEADTDFRLYSQHISGGVNYEPTYFLWNASLQRSFLRDKNLTLCLAAVDLLGQLRQGGTYVESTRQSRGYVYNETIRRYVLFSLLFRFATKKRQ